MRLSFNMCIDLTLYQSHHQGGRWLVASDLTWLKNIFFGGDLASDLTKRPKKNDDLASGLAWCPQKQGDLASDLTS